MDTKSKKSTAIISIIAFFLGASLVIGGITPFAWYLAECANSGTSPVEHLQPDVQETQEFRDLISAYFETFATLAVGGPLYTSWYQTEISLVEASGQDVAAEAVSLFTSSELNEYLQQDTNLLYNVYTNHRLRYSNTGNEMLDKDQRIPPMGYSFLLYFDGQQAFLYKDGEELSIYGSGVYRGEGWYLPGYDNFRAGEQLADVEIVMAVRKQPYPIIISYYENDGCSYEQASIFYQLALKHQEYFAGLMIAAGSLLVGAVLVALSFAMKKSRRTACAALRQGFSKIWWEGKILLFAAGCLLVAILFAEGSYQYYSATTYALSSPIVLWDWPSPTQVHLYAYLPPILLGFWLAAFAIFDLQGRPWKNTFIGRVFLIFRKNELSKPFFKRIQRRSAFFFGGSAILLTAILCLSPSLLYLWGYDDGDIVVCFGISLVLGLLLVLAIYGYIRRNIKTLKEADALSERILEIRNGVYSGDAALPPQAELAEVSQNLQEIQSGMNAALEQQVRSERMKVELITNVSHDLKTPLTSIISYTELLGEEELSPQAMDYVRILRNKAQRLKSMVQDIFEVSKAASGQLPISVERLDLAKLIRQTLADMEEAIAESPLTFRTQLPEEPVFICADGQRLYRVFQNLIQNVLQYSLEGSRVYIQLTCCDGRAHACIKNISKYELPADCDFTERFVRGDDSRSDGGSGLGLSIAQSFTEACGGELAVETDGDQFSVSVFLPLAQESPEDTE